MFKPNTRTSHRSYVHILCRLISKAFGMSYMFLVTTVPVIYIPCHIYATDHVVRYNKITKQVVKELRSSTHVYIELQ